MLTRATVATLALLASACACGSSGRAPRGAVTDCDRITYHGSVPLGGGTAAQRAGRCFVDAVHACHAARLELVFAGVDAGTDERLTVRRASHGSCVTSVATTSFVLTQTTHRHEVCRTATVAAAGVDLANCKR